MDDKGEVRRRSLLWSGGVALLWMGSGYVLAQILSSRKPAAGSTPTVGDLAAIFFGASSLALIIFSLVVAVAALIQWQALQNEVRKVTKSAKDALKNVREATKTNENSLKLLDTQTQNSLKTLDTQTQERLHKIEAELRGRVDAVMGAMIGTLHSKPDRDTQTEEDRDYIADAIHHIRTGYDRLKALEGNGRYMALNNLVYFSCLLGEKANKDELLLHGHELRDVGRKYQSLPYAAPYLMTFCRVALVYQSDREELEQALAIAQNLLTSGLNTLQRKEATYLVASLSKKIEKLFGSVD